MSSTVSLLNVSALGPTITDGTATGAQVIAASSASFQPLPRLVTTGSHVLSVTFTNAGECVLWMTDGTAACTSLITALQSSAPTSYANLSGLTSVGTASGAQLLAPYVSGGFTVGTSTASLGASVAFSPTRDQHQRDSYTDNELWVTNATTAATSRVITLPNNTIEPLNQAQIPDLTSIGSKALFEYDDGTGNQTLWVTDATASGTFELTAITNPHVGILGAAAASHRLAWRVAETRRR